MATYFFDSSALVKHYVIETGSSWVTQVLSASRDHQIYVTSITAVEVIAALTRRERGKHLPQNDYQTSTQQFCSDLKFIYQIVDLTDRLITQAMRIAQSYALRGYDAVQLAAALAINSELQFAQLPSLTLISADNELNLAAQKENLLVKNPNDYP